MSVKTEKLDQDTLSWRKRPLDDEPITVENPKRPRYYFRLESESSRTSTSSDTETVYSLQDKETDYVRDTSDTDDKSTETYEVEIEYDVASLSGDEEAGSSSSCEEMLMAAAAAVIYDGSYSSLEEAWITDVEDSDSCSLDDSYKKADFWTCIICKSQNKNPLFRYCEKCFQERKECLPPRPKPHKKKNREHPVKLDTLRSCLSGLSHDSGIGSSQECPPLELDQIVVPKHLHSSSELDETDKLFCSNTVSRKGKYTPSTKRLEATATLNGITTENETITKIEEKITKEEETITKLEEKIIRREETITRIEDTIVEESTTTTTTTTTRIEEKTIGQNAKKEIEEERPLKKVECNTPSTSCSEWTSNRKRQISESSLSDDFEFSKPVKRQKKNEMCKKYVNELPTLSPDDASLTKISNVGQNNEKISKDMCLMCVNTPKDSIFLHGRIGHMSCCYKCAMRTWKTTKRCPVCNRKVNNVVKVFGI